LQLAHQLTQLSSYRVELRRTEFVVPFTYRLSLTAKLIVDDQDAG
jgi:hypothetical protein